VKDEPRSPVSLLAVEHDVGVAAVCRDAGDGSLWLTAELGSGVCFVADAIARREAAGGKAIVRTAL
jgi:hypothetical protein